MTWGKPKSKVRMHCIAYACRCTVDKALHPYADEVVCQKCWKTVPFALKDTYRQFRRTERRYRKWEAQGNMVQEGTWRWIAKEQALNWAKIRDFVTAKPEIPAGLTGFLQEIGLERRALRVVEGGTDGDPGRDQGGIPPLGEDGAS